MDMNEKSILENHGHFYEALMEHPDAPTPDAAVVASAMLTVAFMLGRTSKVETDPLTHKGKVQ